MPILINQGLIPGSWRERFCSHLDSVVLAKNAYQRLEKSLGESTLRSYLYLYTSPFSETAQKQAKVSARRKQVVINKLVTSVKKIHKSVSRFVRQTDEHLRIEVGSPLQSEFDTAISKYTD